MRVNCICLYGRQHERFKRQHTPAGKELISSCDALRRLRSDLLFDCLVLFSEQFVQLLDELNQLPRIRLLLNLTAKFKQFLVWHGAPLLQRTWRKPNCEQVYTSSARPVRLVTSTRPRRTLLYSYAVRVSAPCGDIRHADGSLIVEAIPQCYCMYDWHRS